MTRNGKKRVNKMENVSLAATVAAVAATGNQSWLWQNPPDLNGTWNLTDESWNQTRHFPQFCDAWEAAQHNLFQTANLFFAASFLIPRNYKQNILLVR